MNPCALPVESAGRSAPLAHGTAAVPAPASGPAQPETAAVERHAVADPSARPQRLPLYLVGKKTLTVSADGPALVVCGKHQALLRYPLSRISRVLSGLWHQWRPCALEICQQAGLPIVFLDTAGRVTGYLQPWQPRTSTLHAVITETLTRSRWPTTYQHWYRAECMRMIQHWCEQQAQSGKPVSELDRRQLIRNHVYQPYAGRPMAGWHPLYEGAITAYVMQVLNQAGLEPCYWGEGAHPLRLAHDLTQLAGLNLRLQMHTLGQAAQGSDATLLSLLHHYSENIAARLRTWLGSLHRCLRAELEQWH